jgi:hypothetical protein
LRERLIIEDARSGNAGSTAEGAPEARNGKGAGRDFGTMANEERKVNYEKGFFGFRGCFFLFPGELPGSE